MPQHDKNIANGSGSAVRADINDALESEATWNSGASYPGTTFPHMRVVNTTLGIVARRNLANSGWIVEGTEDESRVLTRSSNSMLDVSDFGKLIVATGAFTQTLDTAANLGEGWWCEIRNDSVGSVVIDPNGSELIDGVTSITLTSTASCRIWCTGTAFKTTMNSGGDIDGGSY